MRGFSKAAALLLVPTAVLARPVVTASSIDNSFTVAVDVGITKHTGTTLVFRIDIQESKQACDTPKVRVDGYLLSQDDTGAGQGTFASASGPAITASWSFTCNEDRDVPWDQDMAMKIMSLDGRAVPDTNFFIRFRQTAPEVKIFQVRGESMFYTSEGGVPEEIYHDALLDELLTLENSPTVTDEVKEEIKEMKALSSKIHDLEGLLDAKEMQIVEKLGLESPPSTHECKDLECVFRTLSSKAQLAHSNLCDTMEERWKAVFGCADDTTRYNGEGNDEVEDTSAEEKAHKEDDDVRTYDYYEAYNGYSRHSHHHRRPVSRIPLLLIVAESAITFGFFFYYILRFIRAQIDARQRRYEIWAILTNDYHEKDEKPVSIYTPQHATMEEEIASFREAASLVDDLISMEEGRVSEQSQSPTNTVSIIDDDAPPAYDGRRHTPNNSS